MKNCGVRSAEWEVGNTRGRAVLCRRPDFGKRGSSPVPEYGAASKHRPTKRGLGFTLIELLAVITIMSIIAAMVVGLSSLAARKKHDAAVNGMKNRLMLFISSYYSKMGFYPPDNVSNSLYAADTNIYYQATGQNPLLYELTGAPMTTNNFFITFDGSNVPSDLFTKTYGRGGIANSLPDETHVFFQPLPSTKDYAMVTNSTYKWKQLVVPVNTTGNAAEINLWHYDSSSTNRHNASGYDLWAVYAIGNGNLITNGNW